MGLFRAIHGAKMNVLASMALCGFYLLTAAWLDHNGVPGLAPLNAAFLAVLVLYGLWTESPIVVLLTMGAIAWAWAVVTIQHPGVAPQLADGDLVPGIYAYALSPVVAAGAGIVLRARLFQRPARRGAAAPPRADEPRGNGL